jgi:hypothetical protein
MDLSVISCSLSGAKENLNPALNSFLMKVVVSGFSKSIWPVEVKTTDEKMKLNNIKELINVFCIFQN